MIIAKQDILVIGYGGHAKSCIDLIERTERFRIVGVVGNKSNLNAKILSYEVNFVEEDLENFVDKNMAICIGIGQIQTAEPRMNLFKKLKGKNFSIPPLVSPSASVSRYSEIGEGCQIFPHAVVQVSSRIGVNSIINSRALIEHDATVGSHCHISTGAILNGSVHVGDETFVGSNATLKNNISIGKKVFIGMATTVISDVQDMKRLVGKTF